MFWFGVFLGVVGLLAAQFSGAILYIVCGGLARDRARLAEKEEKEQKRQQQVQAWEQGDIVREARRQLAIKEHMEQMEGIGAQR